MIYAADFWPKTAQRGPLLAFCAIINGQRTVVEARPVADKREARRLAIAVGATPWNF